MLKYVVALAATLTLGACATPYVATPYERDTANVRTITLIDDAADDEAIAYEVASVGSNFGLIGALVDAGIQMDRQKALNAALKGAAFDGEAILAGRLSQGLVAQGYDIAEQDAGPLRDNRDFLVTYPTPDGQADAYLDVVVDHYGYLSAGAFQPFRPSVSARVRLVKADDPLQILMDNRIYYNVMYTEGANGITLTPNPEYEFKNREELLADPARTAAGIEDALAQVAHTAAQLLR